MRKGVYKTGAVISVDDKMQSTYEYRLEAPMGKEFSSDFTPHLTPPQMLEMGVFEGKYCNDCQ
ncbi:MAG: hypothetical protein ABJN51_00890, partial [Sneathiella sp.]